MKAARVLGGWRQLVLLLMFLGFTALVVTQLADFKAVVQTLGDLVWYWAVVSVALFATSFYLFAMLYRVGFLAVDLEVATASMLPPLMASIFLNTFAPVGEAIFVQDAAEHGRSGAKSAPGVLLVLALDLGTTLPFIATGMVFLGRHGVLPFYDLVTGALFLLVVLFLVAALWLGNVRKQWLQRLLGFARRAVNRGGRLFRQAELIPPAWPETNAEQFSEASSGIVRHPRVLAGMILLGLVMHSVNAAGLYTLFWAFHHPVGIETVIAGFGMSMVLYVIIVTPHGVGAAEGVMSLLFASMGVPAAMAVVVAIAYRILNVWIPVVIGYFFARRMRLFKRPEADPGDAAAV